MFTEISPLIRFKPHNFKGQEVYLFQVYKKRAFGLLPSKWIDCSMMPIEEYDMGVFFCKLELGMVS